MTRDTGTADDRGGDVLLALRRIMRAVDMHSRYLGQQFGLTGPQLLVLRELADRERTVGAVAEAVSLSHATVTGVLDRLERAGLVSRQRGTKDRRQVLVRMTRAGRRLVRSAPPLLQAAFLDRFGALADWEQNQILSSLQRVVAMMAASDIDASPVLTPGDPGAAVSAPASPRPA